MVYFSEHTLYALFCLYITMKKNKSIHYLAMWCNQGLECIFNVESAMAEIEQWEKEKVISLLKDAPQTTRKPTGIPLNFMLLRARVNSHRCYEIYEFSSTLSEDVIRKEFLKDPQPLVDWIRENGLRIYSDYNASIKPVIT